MRSAPFAFDSAGRSVQETSLHGMILEKNRFFMRGSMSLRFSGIFALAGVSLQDAMAAQRVALVGGCS